jgi:hypothetical protein
MKTEYLLIDLENVVPGLISDLLENQIVLIFTGSKQTKIGRDLVVSTQPFGKQIQWIIINGNGKNAADFHIAYYIGLLSEKDPGSSFTILSKDTGFDPLIKHLVSKGVQCRRIEDIKYFGKPISKPKPNTSTKNKKNIDEIVTNLTSHFLKSDKIRRPKKLNKFIAFVKSRGNLSDDVVKAVVDKMVLNKLIEIKDEKIIYSMDDLPF